VFFSHSFGKISAALQKIFAQTKIAAPVLPNEATPLSSRSRPVRPSRSKIAQRDDVLVIFTRKAAADAPLEILDVSRGAFTVQLKLLG
jgi:hypothetical protein